MAYDKKNGKMYIGSTINGLKNRKKTHFYKAKYGKNNTHFYNALRVRPNDFEWMVLEVSPTNYDESISGYNRDREQYWIDLYWGSPLLYNTKKSVKSGTGLPYIRKGRKLDSSTKKKISCSLEGKELSSPHKRAISVALLGRVFTNQHRSNLSKALSGRVFSEEHRQKLSIALRGRPIKEETRKKISEAHKGQTHTEETKQKIREASTGRVKSQEERNKISESRRGEKHPFYGKSFSKEHRKNLSKAQSGEKGHNYGKPPWEMYKREDVLIVWKSADKLYDYWNKTKVTSWGLYCEFKYLERSADSFRKIHGKFLNGWNPYDDPRWLNFSKSNPQIV